MEPTVCPIEIELNTMLERVFADDERTRETMARHNGFNCRRREKLEDIANDMSVTKEAVRQRSIKGIARINEEIAEIEKTQEALVSARTGSAFLEVVAPCSESDAQKHLFNEGLTQRADFDVEALIYMLNALNFATGVSLVKEGEGRFIVKNANSHVIKSIVKKAREEVTAQGAGDIISLARLISSGHQRIENQIRCVVATLEAQPDFVWLTEDYLEGSVNNQRIGHFLLKEAGRNPVELRLRRIFSVRERCHEKWIHAKITRSRKAMQRDMRLPVEAITRVGIEKGICEMTDDPHILKRAMPLDPEDVLQSFEYRLWLFLKDHPRSKDADIMEAVMRRDEDQFNIRSKLNFSVVIQRVEHGIYAAVTDDYPELRETSIAPHGKKKVSS